MHTKVLRLADAGKSLSLGKGSGGAAPGLAGVARAERGASWAAVLHLNTWRLVREAQDQNLEGVYFLTRSLCDLASVTHV